MLCVSLLLVEEEDDDDDECTIVRNKFPCDVSNPVRMTIPIIPRSGGGGGVSGPLVVFDVGATLSSSSSSGVVTSKVVPPNKIDSLCTISFISKHSVAPSCSELHCNGCFRCGMDSPVNNASSQTAVPCNRTISAGTEIDSW